MASPDTVWHSTEVTPAQRQAITRVRPRLLWFTGLSGCGKSTIAMRLEHALIAAGHLAYVLDGDNIRHGLNQDLRFSAADRTENIRRVGEVGKLFVDAGVLCIASFISPYRADRELVRHLLPHGSFSEVFVDAPLEICEQRDPKGLYKKARKALAAGNGLSFTGIDAPYEPPTAPELHLETQRLPPEACVERIMAYLHETKTLVAQET